MREFRNFFVFGFIIFVFLIVLLTPIFVYSFNLKDILNLKFTGFFYQRTSDVEGCINSCVNSCNNACLSYENLCDFICDICADERCDECVECREKQENICIDCETYCRNSCPSSKSEIVTETKLGEEEPATAANPIVPSIQGFGSNLFTGASTINYPIILPSGPGGTTPTLGFTYSSSSIDDMRLGIDSWKEKYRRQAGWLGLGWNLAGLGYIVRDNGPDYNTIRRATNDDRFYLVFPGGSAEIVKKNGEWKTDPNLFLKIEHRIPHDYDYHVNKYVYDTAPWKITTPDGTEYYFGNPIDTNYVQNSATWGYLLRDDGSPFPINLDFDQLKNQGKCFGNKKYDCKAFDDSLSTAYIVITSYKPDCLDDTSYCDERKASTILPYKWMLRKIVDTHGNTIEFEYETRVKYVNNYGNIGGWSSIPCSNNRCPNHYIHSIVPKRIRYSNAHITVEFEEEARDDYKIEFWDSLGVQNFWNMRRLKAIYIKVDGNLVRKYVLDYDYIWKEDEKGHSLLKKITHYGRDAMTKLPSYEFNYDLSGVGFGFNNVVLKTASNGYGGRVEYYYETYEPEFCDSAKLCNCCGRWGTTRNRVKEKMIFDGMGNIYKISYIYGESMAYVRKQGDSGREHDQNCPGCFPFSGFEFLGYSPVNETIYAMNDPLKIERKTSYYFYQHKESSNCFKPDPRKGITYKVEVYDNNEKLMSKTESSYLPDKNCEEILHDDIYFPHLSQTDVFIDNKHTRTRYYYDVDLGYHPYYGNLLRTEFYGDVREQGDEKTIHTGYYPNTNSWIINLPAWINVYNGISDNVGGENLKTQTLYFYDGQDRYDVSPKDKGELTKTGKGGAGYPFIYTHFEYDRWGNLVKQWDANTDPEEKPTTQTWYDNTYHTYPVKIENALGHVFTTDYDYVLGVPISFTDSNGVTIRYDYDPLGRLTTVIKPGDTKNSPTIEHHYYDPTTDLIFEENEPKLLVETKNKLDENKYLLTRTFYNGLGQIVQTHTAKVEVEGEVKDLINTIKYNSFGQKTVETLTYAINPYKYDGTCPFTWEGYNSAPKTTYKYDSLGRITEVKDPMNRVAKTFYFGWSTLSLDPEGHQTVSNQDAYGRLVEVINFVGEYPNTRPYAITTYEYDILDNLVKVTAPQGIVTHIHYDSLGRKISMDDPDLGHWEYRYDNNGNLIWQKDAKGQIITFYYDKLNRLWRVMYPDGSSVYYWYDKPNPDGCNKQDYSIGRRVEMNDLTGKACYSYDERGRITEETKRIGEEEAVTQFTYNPDDSIKTIVYPDGEVVVNEYDSVGRLKRLTGQDVYLDEVNYDVLGNVKEVRYGNLVKTRYAYDVTGRLQQIHTSGQTDILKLSYIQDKVGNVLNISDLIDPSNNLQFFYDDLNRLTGASGQYVAEYQYDLVGNMLKKVEGDSTLEMFYTDPTHVHAPKVVNGFEYKYDANGNLIEDEKRCIEWNYDNMPIRIIMKQNEGEVGCDDYFMGIKKGVTTEFAYDGDGKRVIKRVLD